MDHPVAAEPVVVDVVDGEHRRIGSVPQQSPLEIRWDHAGDREFDAVVPLVEDRREVPLEIRVWHRAVLGRVGISGDGAIGT